AIRYARSGLPVLPTNERKHPLTRRGFHDASTDPTEPRTWPRDTYGVAIATGRPLRSGGFLWVLDVDVKHDGDYSVWELEEVHGELPPTWTVRTPSGGWHRYYRTPEPLACRTGFLPGLDVRAGGGYVVAPPTPGYRVERMSPIADAPGW